MAALFPLVPPAGADVRQLKSNFIARTVLPTVDRPNLAWRCFWSAPTNRLADLSAKSCESEDFSEKFAQAEASKKPYQVLCYGKATRMHVALPGVDIAITTDNGGKIRRNDDATLVSLTAAGQVLVGVADGVGSCKNGDLAAQISLMGSGIAIDEGKDLRQTSIAAREFLEEYRQKHNLPTRSLHTTLCLSLLDVTSASPSVDDLNVGDSSDLLYVLDAQGYWQKIKESKTHSVSHMVRDSSQVLLDDPATTSKEERDRAFKILLLLAEDACEHYLKSNLHRKAEKLVEAILSFRAHHESAGEKTLDQTHPDFKFWCDNFILICDDTHINKHPLNHMLTAHVTPGSGVEPKQVDLSTTKLDPNKIYLKIKASDCLLDNFTDDEIAILAHGLTDAVEICQVLSEALQAKMRVQKEIYQLSQAMRENSLTIFLRHVLLPRKLAKFIKWYRQKKQRAETWLRKKFKSLERAHQAKKIKQRDETGSLDLTKIIGGLNLTLNEYDTAMKQLDKKVAKLDNQTVMVLVAGKNGSQKPTVDQIIAQVP